MAWYGAVLTFKSHWSGEIVIVTLPVIYCLLVYSVDMYIIKLKTNNAALSNKNRPSATFEIPP